MIVKLNFADLIKGITILLLISIFVFNIQEYAFYLNITSITNKISFIYKIGKDLGFILIITLSFFHCIYIKKISIFFPFFYSLILYILCAILLTNNIMLALSGIRWILPIFLILCYIPYIDKEFMEKVTKTLYYLLIVQVIFQVLQILFMPPIYGTNILGLSARNPGFLVYPSTAGLFANTCFIFCYIFKKNKLYIPLVVLSLLICMSSTGMFIFLIICFFLKIFESKHFKLLLISLPLIAIVIFANLDTLTGREAGSSDISSGTRIEILKESLNDISIISDKFGTATNTAVGLNIKDSFIADSSYTSVLVNLGGIGIFFVLTFLGFVAIYSLKRRRKDILLFLILWALGGVSIIITENFPMNLLFAISVSYYLKREYIFYKKNNKSKKNTYAKTITN